MPVASIIEQNSVKTTGRAHSAGSTGRSDSAAAAAASYNPDVSFALRIVGSEGTEISAVYSTARQRVLDAITEVGSIVYSNAHTALAVSGHGLKRLSAQVVTSVRGRGGAIAATTRELPSADTSAKAGSDEEGGPELLWRAALRLQMLPPYRAAVVHTLLSTLDTSSSSSGGEGGRNKYSTVSRMVLMEAALFNGLAHTVAEYLTTQSDVHDFICSDVKRVYEWAVGTDSGDINSAVSVQSSVESYIRSVCKNDIVLPLLHAEHACTRLHTSASLQVALDGVSALQLVVEALLLRKQHGSSDAHGTSNNEILAQVVEQGQLSLRVHIQELLCMQQVVSVLLEVVDAAHSGDSLQFCSLLPSTVYDHSTLHSPSSSHHTNSMLSDYHSAQHRQLQTYPHLRYLPEYLRAADQTLFDELYNMLDAKSAKCVEFLKINADSAIGVNLTTLANSIVEVLFLPLTALRAESTRFITSLHTSHAQRSVDFIEECEASMSGKSQVGHSLALYFLLQMLYLSQPSLQSGLNDSGTIKRATMLCKKVGNAAGLTHTVRTGVLALWQVNYNTSFDFSKILVLTIRFCIVQIDASVAVPAAVSLVASSSTAITRDEAILTTLIRKLLSSDHLAECRTLLQYLLNKQHNIVRSKFFIMATAAAVPRPDLWQVRF